MAASVDIYRWTGTAPGTPTALAGGNTRANAEDVHSPTSTNNPVQIPTGSPNYSYWVSTRLRATTAPANRINNLRWYTDGTNNFSANNSILCVGNDSPSYVMALGTLGQTGTQLTTGNYSGLTGTPTDVFLWKDVTPKALPGELIGPATGDIGSFFVYQISVANNAVPGLTNPETFYWKYDET